jgi:hypothetical protein
MARERRKEQEHRREAVNEEKRQKAERRGRQRSWREKEEKRERRRVQRETSNHGIQMVLSFASYLKMRTTLESFRRGGTRRKSAENFF